MTGSVVVPASLLDEAGDALLADRAADGDARAFAVLVRRHSGMLRAYARRVLGSNAASDDVVQEALITAWRQLPELRDRAAVRGWLIRIVGRKAIDVLRAQRPAVDIDDHDAPAPEGGGPEGVAGANALAGSLDEALRTLPEAQRRAWTLRELGGLGYDEIATDLGLPVSTVRGLLARARTGLIQRMDGWR
ncbi:RNA polymerase sigma factor [Amnibacterium endophyticum]|uniref:RNA polymerase sigma factor n=1 Tax=Amnibacterium endophyticum TaxID=2109337 RepID=A0ABW4LCR3_9MICO